MLAGNNADTNWSEKKMEGDDGLRTLECLRGRLIAERASSKVAKEDAELMGKKLIELETQLRVEIKSKNKAEKKLKFLMKKLESLKISYVLEESEQSSSSENWEASCGSSLISSSTEHPEEQESESQIQNTEQCTTEEVMKETNSPTIAQENLKQSVSETSVSNQSHTSPSSEEFPNSSTNSNCKDDSIEKSNECKSNQICEDSKIDEHSSYSSNSSMEDYVDNSLALVLVPESLQAASQNDEMKRVSGSVGDVLEALRHAREKLQRSMEKRHMIKVGSIDTMIC